MFFFVSSNASGSSTPTHSLNDGSSDSVESDTTIDVRSMKPSLPTTSNDDEFDTNQSNEFPSLQLRSVRNPLSVMQRISSLMAIRNNVSTDEKKTSTPNAKIIDFHRII